MKTIDFPYFTERYNSGEMSDSEKHWFLNELGGNEKLRNEVKLRKLTDKVLEDQDVISLRSKLSLIEKRRESESFTRRRLKPVYLQFVAAVAGIVLIGSISLLSSKNLRSDEILNRFYKDYELPTGARSASPIASTDFSLAVKFYNTHEYDKAAVLFSKVLEKNPKDMQSKLLYGISKFGEKQYPEAKQSFIAVIDNNDSYFIEDARFYLALCYVKTNEKDKAISQLNIIKKEGGIHRNDAIKIIRRFR